MGGYSLQEQFTGEYWVDGKPIYQQVFIGEEYTATIKLLNNVSVSTIDTLVDATARIKVNLENRLQWRTIPWCFRTTTQQEISNWFSGFYIEEDEIRFQIGERLLNGCIKYNVIIKYTKV